MVWDNSYFQLKILSFVLRESLFDNAGMPGHRTVGISQIEISPSIRTWSDLVRH